MPTQEECQKFAVNGAVLEQRVDWLTNKLTESMLELNKKIERLTYSVVVLGVLGLSRDEFMLFIGKLLK